MATQSSLMPVSQGCATGSPRGHAPGFASCDTWSGSVVPDRFRWHETRAQQASLSELAQPFGILDIGLRPGTCFTCRAFTSRQSNWSSSTAHTGFQNTVLPSRLGHPERPKPVRQGQQASDRGRELRDMLLTRTTAGHPHTRGHLLLMHIQRAGRSTIVSTKTPDPINKIVTQGPLRTNESDKRAHGNNPDHRGDPHAKLSSGSQAPRTMRRRGRHHKPSRARPATGSQLSWQHRGGGLLRKATPWDSGTG